MSKESASPLAFLQQHFDALKPREVEIKGFPFKLFFQPLNAEQTLKLGSAVQDKNPRTRALAYAELMVESIKLEDGNPAFELVKGGPNPVEVLTKGTPPKVFTKMVNILIDWITAEAEDLVKK